MGLFDSLFGSKDKKKNRRGREGRRREGGERRRIDDGFDDDRPPRRRPDGERGHSDGKRRRRRPDDGGPPPPPEDGERRGRRRRPDDRRRRRPAPGEERGPPEGRRRRRPDDDEGPRGRRNPYGEDNDEPRGSSGRRSTASQRDVERNRGTSSSVKQSSYDDEEDVFVISPEGDRAKVERRKKAAKTLKDGKFEISVGSPTLTGEGTTGEGGILQTVLKSKVTGDLKPTLKEARLKKVEKTITDMQLKVQNLEENTGAMRSDLAEIKESVSRMEIAVNDVEDIKEEYSNMEKSLRELSALYDLLSSYTNPFIESIDLPKRTGAGEADEEGVENSGSSGEDADFKDLNGLSENVNPFIDDIDAKKTKRPGKDKQTQVMGEPVQDDGVQINKDFWMLKWAKYLSIKVRPSQVHKLLEYYRELGWIDPKTEDKMLTYFDGSRIDAQDEEMMDSDTIITEDGKVITEESEDAWKMSMDDHSKSLEFIGKVKSNAPID